MKPPSGGFFALIYFHLTPKHNKCMNYYSKIFMPFALLCCLMTSAFAEQSIINVGGYNFPPFVDNEGQTGLVQDLIKKLNQSQTKFKFVFTSTSPNRRYRDLKEHKIDAIFFEDEAWGWTTSKIPYQKTNILLNGGEHFVALAKPGRDQKFFDSFKGKKVRGIFGYHYNFADMNTDAEVLRKKGISLGQTNEENVKDLLNERVDIIVLNSFTAESLAKKDQALGPKLLISNKKDQNYQLRILLNDNTPITAMEIEKLVVPLLK